MKEILKKLARKILITLGIPATKNIEYDIYTSKIFKLLLNRNSNCVDVGAHKGEILDELISLSPNGNHYAFEPIPSFYHLLKTKYEGKASVYPYALSDESGFTTFQLVLDDPAYSGLKRRQYKNENTEVEEIQVETKRLDEVLANRKHKIDLIKIDVEGGEFGVLKGAGALLSQDLPAIIFEFGKGASEFYGTKPSVLFDFFMTYRYEINTLKGFHHKNEKLSASTFQSLYDEGKEYYFIATHPKN
jgi:FkbM family methyltransferase